MYISFSLQNADVRLSKELKIECKYEKIVKQNKTSELHSDLNRLREVLERTVIQGENENRLSTTRNIMPRPAYNPN